MKRIRKTIIRDVGLVLLLLAGFVSLPGQNAWAGSVSTYVANPSHLYLPLILKDDPTRIIDEFPFTDRCVDYLVLYDNINAAKIIECVTNVRLRADELMYFDVRWTVEFLDTNIPYLYKDSDAENYNKYITDTLGNRYDHIDTGGAAATLTYFYPDGPLSADGWFLFPARKIGATTFAFHDDDLSLVISNIALIH